MSCMCEHTFFFVEAVSVATVSGNMLLRVLVHQQGIMSASFVVAEAAAGAMRLLRGQRVTQLPLLQQHRWTPQRTSPACRLRFCSSPRKRQTYVILLEVMAIYYRLPADSRERYEGGFASQSGKLSLLFRCHDGGPRALLQPGAGLQAVPHLQRHRAFPFCDLTAVRPNNQALLIHHMQLAIHCLL